LEHEGVSVLLLGDAHASTLAGTLKRLATERAVRRLPLDAVKLPHHGSMANISADWLQVVDCDRWLISTSGAVFGHPDIETVELIAEHCTRKPTFYCNYLSDTTRPLENSSNWTVIFPEKSKSPKSTGLVLRLTGGAPSDNAKKSKAVAAAKSKMKPKKARVQGAATRLKRAKP
jgi:hypothetical protein